ncbi:hypothetical protein BYT27DRAFT_6491787 [Phlegmacium glaucopus]|nr:hypothetical protein BYT27DRAFT_6491787 [Phlegmacium glaucopus]
MNDSNDTSGNDPSGIEGPPPVFKLANDLLAYIYLMNATCADCQYVERVATTLASSQVCAIWRSVALEYRKLWLYMIDFDNHSLDWIDEMLRRSDPALFNFGYHFMTVPEERRGLLELVFKHSSRLNRFSLQTPISNWELVRSRFLQKPAPNLQYMDFCVLFDNECVLTDPLFDNHAPNLRYFELRHCAVDFTSPTLALLTELYVHHITVLDAAPTVTTWLHALGGMPFLQRITIIDAISDAVAQTEFPIIRLVHLENLFVEGGFRESVTLINQAITPPRCSLMLKCNNAHSGPEQQMLWAMIDKKLDFWEQQDTPTRRFIANLDPAKSFTIGNVRDMNLSWGDNEAEELDEMGVLPLDPFLAVSLRSHDSDDIISLFVSLFGLFERTFPATIYLDLCVDYRGVNGVEVFRPLVEHFRSFVKLACLNLINDSHEFILPLLQRISSSGSVLLPVLHSVSLTITTVRRNSDLTLFIAFLRWRREQGFPIHELDVDNNGDLDDSQVGDVEVEMGDPDPDTDEEEDN